MPDALRSVLSDRLRPLHYRGDGQLCVDGREVKSLARDLGTPLHVHDLRRVEHNVAKIAEHYAGWGAEHLPQFAIKSCYHPGVLSTVLTAGWGVEVMSELELSIALAAGAPPAGITLTGMGWSAELARRAVTVGVGTFVVDSLTDLDMLDRVAQAAGVRAEILLRLNLQEVDGTFLPSGARLGLEPGSVLLATFVERAGAAPGLRLVGLHAHQFNRLVDPGAHVTLLQELMAAINAIPLETEVPRLSIGGGLAPYWHLEPPPAPPAAGPWSCHLRTEFGRVIVADASWMLTTVSARKQQGGRIWVVVDAPTSTLVPVPGARFPPVPVELDGRDWVQCSVADGLGSPAVLCADTWLPDPKVGDLLCLLDAGAYTTVFSHAWGGALPQAATITMSGEMVVRTGGERTHAALAAIYGPGFESG